MEEAEGQEGRYRFNTLRQYPRKPKALVLEIVKGVNNPWFGINLDTGNFNSEDPYGDLALCAPYAVNVQLKVKMKNAAGEIFDTDYERIGKILADANYRGYLVLEFEENNPFDHVPDVMDSLRKCIPA